MSPLTKLADRESDPRQLKFGLQAKNITLN